MANTGSSGKGYGMSPLDECECGDYRRDHPNDGPCLFNDGGCGHGYGGDGHHGLGRCLKFRLQLANDNDSE